MQKRIEKDLTQKALAKRMKTNQATISRFESGTFNPSFNFMKRLAKALDAKLTVRIN